MKSPRSLLPSERGLTPSIAALGLSCGLTAISTYAIGGHSSWLQWSVLCHVAVGVGLTFMLLRYLYVHVRRTLGIRRVGVLSTGLLSLLPVLLLLASGWRLLLYGQREGVAWVYSVHVIAGLVLLGLVPAHVALHLVKRSKKSLGPEGDFPSVPAGTLRRAAVFAGGVQLAALLVGFIYAASVRPYSDKPAVADYEYSYGEHRFRPSQTETSNGAFIDERQVGRSERCISCHHDIGEQWIASVHRQAASDPAYVRNVTLLATKRGISATRYCEGCHAPVALLSGELSPGGQHGGIVGTPGNLEGVSCMGCHGIDSLVHLKGVASFSFTPRNDYLFAHSNNPLLARVRDLLIRVRPQQHKSDLGKPLFGDPKFCAGCHTQFMDKDFNNWGWVKMQDDYAAWLKSPYSGQHEESFSDVSATRCQDCHMPLVASDDPSADENGMVRSHRFLGANTFLPILNGDEEHLALLKSFLQSNKVRISIEHPHREDTLQTQQPLAEDLRDFEEAPYFYYLGETASLRVAVSNRGVGHDFPGGTLDVNEAWVDFRVLDAEGSEVYASGAIGEDSHVDPEAYFYRSLPVDKGGNLVWRHDLFNMIGESFKRAVPAGTSDVVEYSFVVPAWAKSPLTVTATLRYRKLNERYARWALHDKYVEIPPVDLAWASLDVPLKLRRTVN